MRTLSAETFGGKSALHFSELSNQGRKVLNQVCVLSDSQVREAASRFGTPLYVVSEPIFRQRIQSYFSALRASASKVNLAYASKANSHLALVRIAWQEGCKIDAASEGEIQAALRGGVPASSIQLHGNNKSDRELELAIELGICEIIVDNFAEISKLAALGEKLAKSPTKLLLRLAPGVDPKTHKLISTGQEDSKFGLNIADGSASEALGQCLEAGLPVVGFHAHVGSQLLDSEAQIASAQRLAQFAVESLEKYNFRCQELNLGGGLGIDYGQSAAVPKIEDYVNAVTQTALQILKVAQLDPVITHEPGRALIGPAGVTIYEIGQAKAVDLENGNRKVYVAVNGGLADNPRPALYDAVYQVLVTPADSEREFDRSSQVKVSVCGRHCETDNLFADVEIPSGTRTDDFLQVLATGAYNNSMASNYNRYPRPKMAMIRSNGEMELIQVEETWDQMFEREILPEGL